jgi:hypothetical protein
MTVNVQWLAIGLALLIGAIGIFLAIRGKPTTATTLTYLLDANVQLQKSVTDLKVEVATLTTRIETLTHANIALKEELTYWQTESATWQRRYDKTVRDDVPVAVPTTSTAPAVRPGRQQSELLRPLLFLRPDTSIGEADEQALQFANIGYLRLVNCNSQQIEDEMQRRQQEHNFYRYVHISAHSSRNTANQVCLVLANGELVDGAWLAKTLRGIHLLFLNACTTVELADTIVGSVENVLVTYEGISETAAGELAKAFWKEIGRKQAAAEAFKLALAAVPDCANFVDLRQSKRPAHPSPS